MPAPIVIPFNFEPIQTFAQTASYTVPAGKYAYVNIAGNLTALATTANLNHQFQNNLQSFFGNSVTENCDFGVWLKSGSVISFSVTNATGSANITVNGGGSGVGFMDQQSSSTSLNVLINSVSAYTLAATAHCGIAGYTTVSVNANYATFTGTNGIRMVITEYNKIS